MYPNTSSVREVLQWINEFKRIDNAREVELGKSPKNFVLQYGKIAKKLGEVETVAVGGALGKVAEIDKQRCGDRLERDETIRKWTEFLSKKKACKDKGGFNEAANLVEQAQSATDPRQAQQYLAQARQKLWNKLPEGMLQEEIPGVPSGQSARSIDPEKAVQALKRKDLDSLIARNDTWGNFDPAKALGSEPSEEDLKVLLNIIEAAMEADAQDAAWEDYKTQAVEAIKKRNNSRVAAKVYKEVIIGAGASAAYYIAANFGKFDMPNTMILGKLQPWANERGKSGNVNHPHNQIDPQQKGSKAIEDDEEGLAEREEFSRRIAEIIAKVPHTQCNITKVSRCEGDFFEILTDGEKFYASKVTNAMGIGKQKAPDLKPVPSSKTMEKVHDMDKFKRDIDGKSIKLAHPLVRSVCVSGGNAAIDVITAIIRDQDKEVDDKLQVHWIVGESGPAFLNGTDNALASKAYPTESLFSGKPVKKGNMTVYRGYLTGAAGEGPITVTRTYKAPTESDENAKKSESFDVDLVVYGTGPDVEEMQKLFVDETKGKPMELEPVIDKGRHYNVEIAEKDPEELLKKLDGKLKDEEAAQKLLRYLQDPSLKGVKDNKDDVIVSLKSKDEEDSQSSMQFVGASGARLKTGASSSVPLSSPKHETMASLPENVVGNDQLTSSRSRVEAQFNALPTSTGDVPLVAVEGGVNFITGNQTVIRVHIAECYPKIPPGLGDYVTAQIIFERSRETKKGDKPKTPIPMPSEDDELMENLSLEQQREFQKKWTERLKDISAGIK